MESKTAIRLVEDLYDCRNMLETPQEIKIELQLLGVSLDDAKANPNLVVEAGIARNFRRACDALAIPISPQQSLTLAKHMLVGPKYYRNGVSLSDQERSIAGRLKGIAYREYSRKQGTPITEEQEREFAGRASQFGEHGLTVGHKIGEASGCFQVLLIIVISTASLLAVPAILWR